MWIDVKIPYEPEKKLAYAYNRAIRSSKAEWVLLLDHDVFLATNPLWYEICLIAIENVGDKAGMITCIAGGEHHRTNKNVNTDIDFHIRRSKEIYRKNKNQLRQIYESVAGFFMLVNKQAWQEVKFENQGNGINNIDIDFTKRLLESGWEIYVMQDLYLYHRRQIRKIW